MIPSSFYGKNRCIPLPFNSDVSSENRNDLEEEQIRLSSSSEISYSLCIKMLAILLYYLQLC